MKKTLVVIAASAVAVSVGLNIYFLTKGFPPKNDPAAVPVPGKVQKKVPPKKCTQKEIFLFQNANYDEWEEHINVYFTTDKALCRNEILTEGAVKVEPKIPVKISLRYSGLQISGDFIPGTSYRIRIAEGIHDQEGNILGGNTVFSVRIPDRRPSVQFLTSGPYLPISCARQVLPYSVLNATDFRLEIKKYYDNIVQALSSAERDGAAERMVYEKKWKWDLPKNKEHFRELDLTQILKKEGLGIYHVSLYYRNFYGAISEISRKVIFTDLGIQAAVTEYAGNNDRAAVFVRSLSSGLPVVNAEVALYSRKGQLFGTGFTDSEGKIILMVQRKFMDETDRVNKIIARKGKDLAVLDLDKSHDLSLFQNSGRESVKGTEGFVYTERGICRPGETIRASLFLRNTDDAGRKSSPCANAPVDMTLTDPAGTVLPSRRVTTDAFGFAECPFRIPADARTGVWQISAGPSGKTVWGTHAFLVGEYVPDRIKVKLIPKESKGIKADQKAEFLGSAEYYFGAPLEKGTQAHFTVVADKSSRLPAAWKEYAVGDSSSFRSGNVFRQKLPLETGKMIYPGFAAQGGDGFSPVTLKAYLTVAEPGGRAVTAASSLECDPSPWYIGLKKEVGSRGKTGRIAWKLLSRNLEEKFMPEEREYKISLSSLEWDYVLQNRNGHYRYNWQQKKSLLRELSVKSNAPEGEFNLGLLSSGEYEILVSSGKSRTRHTFWFSAGETGARSGNPSVLSFRTDKKSYFPGNTAVLEFESPAKGVAFAVTGGRRDMIGRTFSVVPGKNRILVRIPENTVNSVCYSGVTLLTGTGSRTRRAFGLAALNVDLSSIRKIDVGLQTAKKARPCEKIPVSVKLKDTAGKPVPGTVHLFACDEGILSLTAWKCPDIYDFFFGKKYCGISYSDVYGDIFPELSLPSSGRFGGGGAGLSTFLSSVRMKAEAPAVFSLGAFHAGSDGMVRTSVTLPDFTGSLRLTAVAANGSKAGSADTRILLHDDVAVTSSVPAMTAPGDEFEAAFTLFNLELPDGIFSFRAELPEDLKSLSPAVFKGRIAKGGQTTFRIRLKCGEKTGNPEIKYTFTPVSVGGRGNKGKLSVAVRPRYAALSQTKFIVVKKGQSVNLSSEMKNGGKGNVSSRVRISSEPAAILTDSLDFLHGYPYGCLEQTAAAAFPMLCADSLAKCGIILPEQAETARASAMQAAYRILSMMRYDGSFSMWPGNGPEFRSGSLFAAHYLLEADAGTNFSLPEPAKNRICRYLQSLAENASLPRGIRAYAAYVLMLARKDSFAAQARNLLADGKKDLASLFAALSLLRGGYAAEGAEAVETLLKAEVWREEGMPYEYADQNVRMGMTLYLLSAVKPDSPVCLKLLSYLRKSLRTDGLGWGTTHANAWAVLGIASWSAAQKISVKAPGKAELLCGGKALPVSCDKNISLPEGKEIKLVNKGKSALYAVLTSRGIPEKLPEMTGSIRIRREYVDSLGKTVTSIPHGELVTVRLTMETAGAVPDVVIADLLPGGLMIEDGTLATRASAVRTPQKEKDRPHVKARENRDDRMLLFCDLKGKQVYTYQARAVIRGKYALPSVSAEAMYEPDTKGVFAPQGTFEVR